MQHTTPRPTIYKRMSWPLVDILLIIWEVISTVAAISWTFATTLFDALYQIYVSHRGGGTTGYDNYA